MAGAIGGSAVEQLLADLAAGEPGWRTPSPTALPPGRLGVAPSRWIELFRSAMGHGG